MYIFLDESGDLGFDYSKKGTTSFFVVSLLLVKDFNNKRQVEKAVKRTLKNKIYASRGKSDKELKGARTAFYVKEYFYRYLEDVDIQVYTLILNKLRVHERLRQEKHRLYNFVARIVIDKLPVEDANTRIYLYLDKSKNKREVKYFNDYLFSQLEGRLEPTIPLEIYHKSSEEEPGIQAVDMFCWGIFRKYERKDEEWYQVFKDKIEFEDIYLPFKENKKGEP